VDRLAKTIDIDTAPPATLSPSSAPSDMPMGLLCAVVTNIDCTLSNGANYDTITSPESIKCDGGDNISSVTFTFTGRTCDATASGQGAETICLDLVTFNADIPVNLVCQDAASNDVLTITASVASPSTFSLTRPQEGILPDKIRFNLSRSTDNELLQTVIIDVSGDAALSLGDEFGAFKLDACENISCIKTLTYNASVANVGTNQMTVASFTFTFGGHIDDLVPVITTALQPGDSTAVGIPRHVSVCDPATYLAEIVVEANPPGDISCQDEENLQLVISSRLPTDPPTASPTVNCELELDVLCVLGDDGPLAGQPCETPGIGIEPCRERPTSATMLYNGGDCS